MILAQQNPETTATLWYMTVFAYACGITHYARQHSLTMDDQGADIALIVGCLVLASAVLLQLRAAKPNEWYFAAPKQTNGVTREKAFAMFTAAIGAGCFGATTLYLLLAGFGLDGFDAASGWHQPTSVGDSAKFGFLMGGAVIASVATCAAHYWLPKPALTPTRQTA